MIPRTNRISSTSVFETNMECFNSILSQWCDKNDNPTFNHLRGFYAQCEKGNTYYNDTALLDYGHNSIPITAPGNCMNLEVSYSLMRQPPWSLIVILAIFFMIYFPCEYLKKLFKCNLLPIFTDCIKAMPPIQQLPCPDCGIHVILSQSHLPCPILFLSSLPLCRS